MKASSKIALCVAAGVAALACIKKKQSVSGIGAVYIPREVINKARGLFIAYDKACKIEEEHGAKVDAIFDELEAQGIDWQNTEFGKKMAADKLFRAGLSDENGETDVYVNRINARRALLNYIYSDVLPILPLKRSDIELFKNDYSILRQNKLIEIVRGLMDTSGMYGIDDIKRTQLNIILRANPAHDDYHTWIRSVEDIKTFDELLDEFKKGADISLTPDFDINDLRRSEQTKHILLYSSHPINNGVFVTPSKMIAQDYAGGGTVYKKMVHVGDVAWIDFTEGIYANLFEH